MKKGVKIIKKSNRFVETYFSYTDEHGETVSLNKIVSNNYMGESQLGVICECFRDFLLAAGFNYVNDKKIDFIDY